MITIRSAAAPGEARELTAEGHAEYNPGDDIVCAAVSCLLQTLREVLENGGHAREIEAEARKGRMRVRARCDAVGAAAFDFAQIGLEILAQTYPECVQFA